MEMICVATMTIPVWLTLRSPAVCCPIPTPGATDIQVRTLLIFLLTPTQPLSPMQEAARLRIPKKSCNLRKLVLLLQLTKESFVMETIRQKQQLMQPVALLRVPLIIYGTIPEPR